MDVLAHWRSKQLYYLVGAHWKNRKCNRFEMTFCRWLSDCFIGHNNNYTQQQRMPDGRIWQTIRGNKAHKWLSINKKISTSRDFSSSRRLHYSHDRFSTAVLFGHVKRPYLFVFMNSSQHQTDFFLQQICNLKLKGFESNSLRVISNHWSASVPTIVTYL